MALSNGGSVRPIVAETFDLARIDNAKQAFVATAQVGNYVITLLPVRAPNRSPTDRGYTS
jgi:hypothetical protein